MSIEIKDSDNGLGVIVTGRGVVTENEYLDSYKKHLSQDREKYQKYRYSLNDWTAATNVEVSSDAISQIAGLCKSSAKINPDCIVAHVADKDIAFGLCRMWEFLSDETNWEIMVFRNIEDAEGWIRKKLKDKFGIKDLSFG